MAQTKEENPNKYNPPATPMRMLRFDPKKPETYTPSPFVNAFLNIFYKTKADDQDIAKMMELPYRQFSCAFFIETGMTMREFHNYWVAYNIDKAVRENPGIDGDELAEEVGYSDRSGVWRFYNSKTYKRIAAELGLRLFPEPESQYHHRY